MPTDKLFKTNGPYTLEAKGDRLNHPIAQRYVLFFIAILRFMLLILSKYQTTSRLGHSELLVVMSKFDLDVNLQASDPRGKFFMESCVCGPRTLHPHMAFG